MLKTPLKILLAASFVLPGVLLSPTASAGPHGHHHGSHFYAGGYYSYGYYPHPRYYGHYGHRYHHGNAGTYLGVALLGLGLGYAITKSREDDRDAYYRDQYYRDQYYRDQYDRDRYYRERDARGNYATPPPPGYTGSSNQSQGGTYQGFDFSQCEETREYRTTILIDGEEQQAFGTACLMPDGTWVAGPMQIQ